MNDSNVLHVSPLCRLNDRFPQTTRPDASQLRGIGRCVRAAWLVAAALLVALAGCGGNAPAPPATQLSSASVSSLACVAGSVTGSGNLQCTVTLSAAAANSGQGVDLGSSNTAVAVPATVMVPGSAATAQFLADVAPVGASQTAVLTASGGGSSKSFTLQLVAPSATLSLSSQAIAFGNTPVGSAQSAAVTLTAGGSAPATVTSASVTGAGFALGGVALPATLNPGQSMTLGVSFDPLAAGAASGTLTIASNATGGGAIAVALSGAGEPAATAGATYYLAPASMGGNDANNGLSSNAPWASPNHPVNCGDTIVAAASANYQYGQFNTGKWGVVNCPAGNNVAWLKCAAFDGCKIASGGGILVDRSYWGVEGWEVTATLPYAGCFAATPNPSNPVEIHHIIFANDVANGCQSGGFIAYNNWTNLAASVDYISIVGNVVYNGAQGNAECYSGISIYEPIQYDSAAGTHIYVGGNFSFASLEPSPCAGGTAPGGDGIIFDTFDGSQGGLKSPYAAQTVADNNILVGSNGNGIAVQNNVAGSAHAPVVIRNNTSWGNNAGTTTASALCSEILINSGYAIEEYGNLAVTDAASGCGGYAIHALQVYDGDATDSIHDNFLYSASGSNEYAWGSGSFAFGAGNQTGTNPGFANPVVPDAPNCSGFASVPACMANVVANFTPTNSTAAKYGYRIPSNTPVVDSLFPQWLCNAGLPGGLVTMGCQAQE